MDPENEIVQRVRAVIAMLRDARADFITRDTALDMVTDALDGPEVIAAEEADEEAAMDVAPITRYNLIGEIGDDSPLHLGKEARASAEAAADRVIALLLKSGIEVVR